MNHCLLEVEVKTPPTVRYTQDNKTPIAEMEVCFDGLRPDDQPNLIKVVGWGNLAQQLQQGVKVGQRLVIEGRLRMNTMSRTDGTKEKKAELTLSKMHTISASPQQESINSNISTPNELNNAPNDPLATESSTPSLANEQEVGWNTSPLIPDTDEIPF